ncbi:SEC-C domain-containing protein [Streptomyces sp. NPDC003077]|uniref:SEC-C domain-containing protein n=1 Tax=Streptomyces sp. NPDC003077 TaxID=3154443 RepID=UPI0033A90833
MSATDRTDTDRSPTPAVPRPRSTPSDNPAANSAVKLEKAAERSPEARAELLIEAAARWCTAGETDRALALYDRLQTEGIYDSHLVEAFRIDTLWDSGREDEARAAAARLRAEHPREAGPWTLVAEVFESAEEYKTAAEWYSAGIAHVLGTSPTLSLSDVEEGPAQSSDLIIGRHRVRRLMRQPHDDWDELAHEVHDNTGFSGVVPLDELHEPGRIHDLASDDPDLAEAEFTRLMNRVAERKALPSDLPLCVPFWPEDEYGKLMERWGEFAEDYGTEHSGHLRHVETTLRQLSEQGAPRLAVASTTVAEFAAYADEQRRSPISSGLRAQHAEHLAAQGRAIAWPPPRNGPCWCGSGRKYKKCCGNPALT